MVSPNSARAAAAASIVTTDAQAAEIRSTSAAGSGAGTVASRTIEPVGTDPVDTIAVVSCGEA